LEQSRLLQKCLRMEKKGFLFDSKASLFALDSSGQIISNNVGALFS
jgi:hypothetical protein